MRGGGNQPVSDFYATLGEALNRTRALTGWSLAEVQRQSEGRFNSLLLASYERGTRRPKVETLCELAEFYGVPVSSFLPVEGGAVMVPLDAVIAQLQALGKVEG